MSITVEHEKRKREILEKSLDVFMDEGFEDTTFQKIAERCGITRTILYLYFKNKREIFNFSIKLFTDRIESALKVIAASPAASSTDKVALVIERTLAECRENRRLLIVIHDFLGHLRTAGGNPDERVRRRTIRMRHLIAGILIEGQGSGEFARFSVKTATDLLYGLIEAEIFRLTVLNREVGDSLPAAARFIAEGFRVGGRSQAAGAAPRAESRSAGQAASIHAAPPPSAKAALPAKATGAAQARRASGKVSAPESATPLRAARASGAGKKASASDSAAVLHAARPAGAGGKGAAAAADSPTRAKRKSIAAESATTSSIAKARTATRRKAGGQGSV